MVNQRVETTIGRHADNDMLERNYYMVKKEKLAKRIELDP